MPRRGGVGSPFWAFFEKHGDIGKCKVCQKDIIAHNGTFGLKLHLRTHSKSALFYEKSRKYEIWKYYFTKTKIANKLKCNVSCLS